MSFAAREWLTRCRGPRALGELDPPTGPTRPEEGMREAILVAAMSLYRHGGYGTVTMRAVAQQLKCTAPAIYHYFLSKEEIF